LHVTISRRGSTSVVRLVNVTARPAEVTAGTAPLATLRSTLRDARAFYGEQREGIWSSIIDGTIAPTADVDLATPLRVTGALAAGVPVHVTLGGREPLARSFVIRGTAAPDVHLRVALPPPLAILPAEITSRRRGIETIVAALGAIELADAYNRYLPSPDGLSKDVEATYVYRSLPRPAARRGAVRDGGSDLLTAVLGGVLGLGLLGGFAAVWARS
jgi:hypothetical protein